MSVSIRMEGSRSSPLSANAELSRRGGVSNMAGASSPGLALTGGTKNPMRPAKKTIAVAMPAVAGSMKASSAFCSRTMRPRSELRQVRVRALARVMRILTARSGGACLWPTDESRMRVVSSCPYSVLQVSHWSRCRETSCISTPLTAPSRYDENRGRAFLQFMAGSPVPRARCLYGLRLSGRNSFPSRIFRAAYAELHARESGAISPFPAKFARPRQSLHRPGLRYRATLLSYDRAPPPASVPAPRGRGFLRVRTLPEVILRDPPASRPD